MDLGAARGPHLPTPVVEQADLFRLEATKKLDPKRRSTLGQFLTPGPVARFMAALFEDLEGHVRLLEAGAGVGTLLAAAVHEATARPKLPRRINVTAFEIDPLLVAYLRETLRGCEAACRRAGAGFRGEVIAGDFIEAGVDLLDGERLASRRGRGFTHAILNPPYKKLNADSDTRTRIRRVGIEASNLYAAFVALAIQLLERGGELVAITPRSFCNGPYFRPFRAFLLRETAIRRIHLFESRTAAFADDEVLQENVIFHLVKGASQGTVTVSSSRGPDDDLLSVRDVPFHQIVRPGDPEQFLHLAPDDRGQQIADAFAKLPCSLSELGLSVSTGKVVDFRVKDHLRQEPEANTFPLIYPAHFAEGLVRWPRAGKKPNALVDAAATSELWMPKGTYVVVKRFSSKEEPRRVVAAIFDPAVVKAEKIGFENHLNVFHRSGEGLDRDLARGLASFLNSAFVDTYFRQFNGHTQVNATDLRSLRYPTLEMLRGLGRSPATSSATLVDLARDLPDVARGLRRQRPRRPPTSPAASADVARDLRRPRPQPP